jgi:glycosyltransferase involved in cell wall biosynthesis
MMPKMLYVAPLKDFSGYANAARDYVRALHMAGCNLVTRALRYDGGDHPYTDVEKGLEAKDLQNVEIVIQHTTPNETDYKPGLFNVNYYAWETDRVPDEWVSQLNKMDLVLVPCEENIIASRKSGVVVPIEKVHHAFDLAKYQKRPQPFDNIGSPDTFKFLTICQIAKKKGIDALLKAYFAEFTPEDDTLLILKVYFGPNDTEEHKRKTVAQVQKIREMMRLEKYPKVFLIHEVTDDETIARLYETSHCYVMPSRGEGWSITHFDAMGYGKPPIAVNWGGPTEFITKDTGWLVDYHMSPVVDMPHPFPYMYTAKDNWAEPHSDSLRKAMRQAHTEWKAHQFNPSDDSYWSKRIAACKKRAQDFSYEIVGTHMRDVIMNYYSKWKA